MTKAVSRHYEEDVLDYVSLGWNIITITIFN